MTLPTANEVDILWGSDGATQTVFRQSALPDIAIVMHGHVLWSNSRNKSALKRTDFFKMQI